MYGKLELEDIYSNFIKDYQNTYFNNLITDVFPYWKSQKASGGFSCGKINGKYQINKLRCGNINSSIDTNTDISGHIYQSPKYQRYQTVFMKIFRRYSDGWADGTKSFGGQYLYGKIIYGSYNSNYWELRDGFSPEYLDIYYDTIATLDDITYYTNVDMHSPIYYSKFGNAIIPLITLDISQPWDTNIDGLSGLYSKDTYNLNIQNFSIDKPIEYPNNKLNITETDSSLVYNIENFFYKGELAYNTLLNHNFQTNLEYIYNYLANDDVDNNDFDFVTVNNEYTIVAGKTYYSNSFINSVLLHQDIPYTAQSFTYKPDTINNLLTSYNNKIISYQTSNYINYDSALGSTFVNLVKSFFNVVSGNYTLSQSGVEYGEAQLNMDEYSYLIGLTTTYNMKFLKNAIQSSPHAIKKITIPINANNCIIPDIAFFNINDNYIYYRIDNSIEFNIDAKYISNLLGYTSNTATINAINKTGILYKYISNIYNTDIPFHSGSILSKELDGYNVKSTYEQFITEGEMSFNVGYTRLNNFDYNLETKSTINGLIINNSFLEPDRFKIYGVAIVSDYLNYTYLLPYAASNFQTLKYYVDCGYIKVDKFPVPMLLNSRDMNICTAHTIAEVNSKFDVNLLATDLTNYPMGVITSDIKKSINEYVLDSTENTLTTYDIDVYNAYNKDSYKYDLYELGTLTKLPYIYMIYDTYTDKFDLFEVDSLTNINYHYKKMGLYQSRSYVTNSDTIYEAAPSPSTFYFTTGVYIIESYPEIDISTLHFTKIVMVNGNRITGVIGDITVNCKVYDINTHITNTVSILVNKTEYIISGNDLIINLEDKIQPYQRLISSITISAFINNAFKNFSYVDTFICKIYTNLSDFISSYTVSNMITYYPIVNAVGNSSMSLVTDSYINVYTQRLQNILPQVIYTKNISLSKFDIDDDVQNIVPDNKLCILYNHYINNSPTTQDISNLTDVDTQDLAIFDKWQMQYNDKKNQNRVLPALIKGNVNKQLKVYMKIEVDPISLDLIETFEYNNLYNVSLKTEADGVLIMDGKITDMIGSVNFHNALKEYKISLILTASHNVNNSITIPCFVTLKYTIFTTEADYLTNTNGVTYDTFDDTILIEVKNRGEYINGNSDHTPKILDYVEYFDIYPQYTQQQPKSHIKDLEVTLFTTDSSVVKISELYFDICFLTEDVGIGIPIDYENNSDPENESFNIEQSNDKEKILLYINWLLRFKCPNCDQVHLKLKMNVKPEYFGFNITAFTIGCYTYNIKLEQFIPNVFFKESADTIMVIDKKTAIEKISVPVAPEIRDSLQSGLDANNIEFWNNWTEQQDIPLSMILHSIDRPNKSKITYILFNSSFNSKVITFDLIDNPTTKVIHNTHEEYSLAPLEFRIITLTESIDVSDYTDTFDSGIALYAVREKNLDSTVTTYIDTAELSIPSMDDYLRILMNFYDKSAKLIEIDYERNETQNILENPNVAFQKHENLSTTKIIKTLSNITEVNNTENLIDIDYIFYINETYNVTVNKNLLNSLVSWLGTFGSTLYLKVPFTINKLYDVGQVVVSDVLNQKNYVSDYTVSVEVNNLFDDSIKYLQLVGTQTNVDQWTFTMNGTIKVSNYTILGDLLNNDNIDISKFIKFGTTLNLPMIDPTALLSLLFQDFGQEFGSWAMEHFGGIQAVIPENPLVMITDIINILPTSRELSRPSVYKNISLIGMSSRKTLPTLIYENIYDFVDTGCMTIINNNLSESNSLTNAFVFKNNTNGEEDYTKGDMFNDSVRGYMNIINTFEDTAIVGDIVTSSTYEELSNVVSHKVTPVEDTVNYDNWLFDDVYMALSGDSFISNVFEGGNGLFTLNLKMSINPGILQKHYISVKCDNNFDAIISSKIVSGMFIPDQKSYQGTGDTSEFNSVGVVSNWSHDSSYEFNYRGDNKISFSHEKTNYISIDLQNLKFKTLSITVDNKIFNMENSPYSLQNSLQSMLLQKPLLMRTADYISNPITIVADTNYKMIFEVPIETFKTLQAYLTIDKIKIADNFINTTDYCIIFGDNNERFNIKTNVTKIINKTYHKYDKRNLKMLIRGFNIPNQSGEFYTTIIIYYTFNGEQLVLKKDIRYRIELPNVLDNEYLISQVKRLDYIRPPFELVTIMSEGGSKIVPVEIGEIVNDSSKIVLLDYLSGSAGCNGSYPDLNQYTS